MYRRGVLPLRVRPSVPFSVSSSAGDQRHRRRSIPSTRSTARKPTGSSAGNGGSPCPKGPPAVRRRIRGDTGREKKNGRVRIEVERFFSVGKREFGAGAIMAGLSETIPGAASRARSGLQTCPGPIQPSFFVLFRRRSGRRDVLPPDRVRRGSLSDSSAGTSVSRYPVDPPATLHFRKKWLTGHTSNKIMLISFILRICMIFPIDGHRLVM